MVSVALVICAAMLALRGTAKALTLLTVALLMALRGTTIALVRFAVAVLLLVLIATKLLFDLVLDLFE